MNKLRSGIVATLIIICAAFGLGLGATVSLVNSDTIRRNVRIAGVNVGGMTRQEAVKHVSKQTVDKILRTVELKAGDRKWSGQLRDLGVRADVDRAVNEAYKVGRDGSFLQRALVCLLAPGADITLRYLVDPKTFDSTLDKIAEAVEVPHKDAQLTKTSTGFSIEPDRIGVKLDREQSTKLFSQGIASGDLSLNVKLVLDYPDINAEHLRKIDTVLSSYTTRFPAWRKERTYNIRLASNKVDGTVIKSDGIFSYNETVGPRLKSLGYQDAPIFVKGKLVPGTGGGICQLSSTIYNAALLANMKIVERSNHSSTVPYVPAGRDATVAYGLLDLRFKNTTSAPIYIASKMTGSYLHVDIYGAGQDKADVNIQVVKNGPLKATVYRIIKMNGKVVDRQLVSRDRYRPAEPMEVASQPKKPKKTEDTISAYPAKRTSENALRPADSIVQ